MKAFVSFCSFLLLFFTSCKDKDNCKDVTCLYNECVEGVCECESENIGFITWTVKCTPCASENFSPTIGIRFFGDAENGTRVGFQFEDTVKTMLNAEVNAGEGTYETFYLDNPDAIINTGNVVVKKCELTEIETVIQ